MVIKSRATQVKKYSRNERTETITDPLGLVRSSLLRPGGLWRWEKSNCLTNDLTSTIQTGTSVATGSTPAIKFTSLVLYVAVLLGSLMSQEVVPMNPKFDPVVFPKGGPDFRPERRTVLTHYLFSSFSFSLTGLLLSETQKWDIENQSDRVGNMGTHWMNERELGRKGINFVFLLWFNTTKSRQEGVIFDKSFFQVMYFIDIHFYDIKSHWLVLFGPRTNPR